MCLDAGSGELGVSRVAEKAGFRVWDGMLDLGLASWDDDGLCERSADSSWGI